MEPAAVPLMPALLPVNGQALAACSACQRVDSFCCRAPGLADYFSDHNVNCLAMLPLGRWSRASSCPAYIASGIHSVPDMSVFEFHQVCCRAPVWLDWRASRPCIGSAGHLCHPSQHAGGTCGRLLLRPQCQWHRHAVDGGGMCDPYVRHTSPLAVLPWRHHRVLLHRYSHMQSVHVVTSNPPSSIS